MVNEINIGITGASGFIGKSLIKYFNDKGIRLIIIHSRLNDFEELKKELELLPILDFVFHLAGSFYGNWDELYSNNVIATKNLLECLNTTYTKIVFTSSGSVCGNSGEFGVDETFECEPVDDYG